MLCSEKLYHLGFSRESARKQVGDRHDGLESSGRVRRHGEDPFGMIERSQIQEDDTGTSSKVGKIRLPPPSPFELLRGKADSKSLNKSWFALKRHHYQNLITQSDLRRTPELLKEYQAEIKHYKKREKALETRDGKSVDEIIKEHQDNIRNPHSGYYSEHHADQVKLWKTFRDSIPM